VPSAGRTTARSVYFGRAGSGAARFGITGHAAVVALASAVVEVTGAEVGVNDVRLGSLRTASPEVHAASKSTRAGAALLIIGPWCQP